MLHRGQPRLAVIPCWRDIDVHVLGIKCIPCERQLAFPADMYAQAIKRDPGFARAYAGLALTHAADYRNGWVGDGQGALDMTLRTAQTALGIEPNMSEQLWVIGYVHTQLRAHTRAEAAFKEALELDPFYADA